MAKSVDKSADDSDLRGLRAMVTALSNPLRARLLVEVARDPLGADELSRRTGEPVHRVRRHLNWLAANGLIAVVDEEARRGAMKRYFALARHPGLIDIADDTRLSIKDRRRYTVGIIRIILEEATKAASSPSLGERTDRLIANVSDRVDLQGWRELSQLHQETLDQVMRIVTESRERLETGEGESIGVISEQIFLEAPQNVPPSES